MGDHQEMSFPPSLCPDVAFSIIKSSFNFAPPFFTILLLTVPPYFIIIK